MALNIDVSHTSKEAISSPLSIKRLNELFLDENITIMQNGQIDPNSPATRAKHSSCELTGSLDFAQLDRVRSWDSDGEGKKKEAKRKEEIRKEEGFVRPRSSSLKRLSLRLNLSLSKKSASAEEVSVLIPFEERTPSPTSPTTPTTPTTPSPPITPNNLLTLERASSAPNVVLTDRSILIPSSVSEGKINYSMPHIASSPELGRKAVTAATEDQLICLLAGETAPDKDFVVHFLLTHHRFITSVDLLQKLMNRYNLSAPENCTAAEAEEFVKRKKIIQVRVINVIKKWIERLVISFQQDEQLMMLLQQFIQTLLASGGTEAIWGSNVQLALLQAEEVQENPTSVFISTAVAPKPILPKIAVASELKFLDINPLEAARQLTVLESIALSRVSPSEYSNKAWCGSKSATQSPNVLEIITRFNTLSYWIASEIVRQPDLNLRVKTLYRFIKLGEMLRTLNNFQGVMTVYTALNMSSVQRLHDTWKAVPSKYMTLFEGITQLMSAAHNYKNYRDIVKNASPPCVPFQGVYLTDLTFMEEAPDFLEKDIINFRKMVLVGDVLNDIQKFQKVKYVFLEVPCIKEYFTHHITALDDKQLHELSRKIEPKKE